MNDKDTIQRLKLALSAVIDAYQSPNCGPRYEAERRRYIEKKINEGTNLLLELDEAERQVRDILALHYREQ